MTSSETKQCQNCQQNFVIEPEDFEFYDKIKVPPPTWCPECRLVRRMVHYNKRTLYKSSCQLCGQGMFSMYIRTDMVPVYCNKCWWSDQWDPLIYQKEYDFSVPFFHQLRALINQAPLAALGVEFSTLINSDYCNAASNLKKCYLVYFADYLEDSYYCDTIVFSKDCFDCSLMKKSDLCLESFNLSHCSQTYYSVDCSDSYDVYFSKNLVGCSNCFGCVNLRKKQFHIFNKQYTKEEYFQTLKDFNLGSWGEVDKIINQSQEFFLSFPNKYMHGLNNNNVLGDYIEHSKNALQVFQSGDVEDSKFCLLVFEKSTKDCYDFSIFGVNAINIYESLKCGTNINNLKFCNGCFKNNRDLSYSIYCHSSSNLFGCIGLRNKSYCILNQQYTKEEYEELVPKIIQHMKDMPYTDKKGRVYQYGEFFPPELSPFAYNETIAQEYFPITKEQALEKGYTWKDPEERKIKITQKTEDLPDHIKDVPDTITQEIIACQHQGHCQEQCTTAFKIINQELAFYRQMNLPLPRLCPNCRHYQRLKQRNPLKLWHRSCQCSGDKSSNGVYSNTVQHPHGTNPCPNEFETSYAPERPEIVYCEQCYQQEVV